MHLPWVGRKIQLFKYFLMAYELATPLIRTSLS